MNDYRLLITIVRRDQGEDYIDFFRAHGMAAILASLCNGTASKGMLDFLGIEKTEKVMLQTVVTTKSARRLLRRLVEMMGIDMPGNGIALTIPVGSIGGASSLNYLTHEQETTIDEVKKVNEIPYALIVAIANKGNTDLVMDAARSAGARGGTVIGAKGTGADPNSKFFGVSIAAEKEIIYIVTKKADKTAIMQAIMEQAGVRSEAHTMLFSLPVDSIAGLHSMAEDGD